MSQSEDMDAINRYMRSQPLKTDEAAEIHDDWIVWFDNLSWWSRTMDGESYDQARNRRNAFNRANAVTKADKAITERVITEGVTTEELAGDADRRLSTGEYHEPLVGQSTKMGLVAIGAGLGIAWLAKKVYLDRFL